MRNVFRKLADHPSRTLAAFSICFVACTTVAFLVDLNNRHRVAIEQAEGSLRSFSAILAEHTARTFEAVDRILGETNRIRERFNDGQYATVQIVQEELRHLQKSSPVVVSIGWTNSAGELQAHSYEGTAPRPNLSHLPYFIAQRDGDDRGLLVAPPFRSAQTNQWITSASRRLDDSEGRFAGILSATLDLSYFNATYRSANLQNGGSVLLLHRDGLVLAREPHIESAIGRSFEGGHLILEHLPRAAAGSYETDSGVDGAARIAGYKAVPGLPLVVLASYLRADALKSWYQHLFTYGPITAFADLAFLFSAALLIRQTERLTRQTNLLAITLDNVAHGLCMYDAGGRLIVSNKRLAEIYALTAEQTKSGTPLRSILEARIRLGTDSNDTIEQCLERVSCSEPHCVTDKLHDGRLIAIRYQPISGGACVAIHEDVTERKAIEQALNERTEALNESNKWFAAALQNMSQGLCMFDASQKVLVVNERYRQIYDLPDELAKPGTTLSQILEYRLGSGNYRGASPARYIESHLSAASEIQELGNGRSVLILRHQMAEGCWLTTHEDITERVRNESRISFMAHHDALTGLANRAALVERIAAASARFLRYGDKFNVLMLDLDRFKQVNDTLGHPAGDALLQQVAARLKSSLRETDVLARLGGDEFAIVQIGDDNPTEVARSLANRIIGLIAEPFSIGGNEVTIGTSIGIALAPEHGINADDLLKMADLALYQTKSRGRNDLTVFDPSMGEAAATRLELESELRRAIAQNELEIFYQPFLDVKSGRISGAEALVRWRHPQKGLILPDRFIPLAEECGLVGRIGEFVLQAACVEAATWPPSTTVAINLSAVQLRGSALVDAVVCVLVESGLPPERLEFEITETALIENPAESLVILRQLKRLGVSIALDDFGTGYSSLSQLTMFPFDKIKIDKSFTQNMTKRGDCAAIISGILALAHRLDIATTAEGVETRDQLRLLSVAGVTTVQGYLIAPPAPASELAFDSLFDQDGVRNVA